MISTLLCLLLFGIITLIQANPNYYNERAVDLISTLSNLKGKYGLNFGKVEGIGSLPKHYKKSHPKLTYKDHNPQKYDDKNKPADINNIEIYNMLVAAKTKEMGRSRDTDTRYCDELDENTKEVLRICRKKPKEYHCGPKNECDVSSESSESEEASQSDQESDSKKRKRYSKKKRYFRTDDNKEHKTVDETALLLDDLEKLLSGNDKYRVFLGCVGRMCGGKTSRDGFDEGGDDKEFRGENLGCIGDRCGRNEDDDDDDRRF